MNRSSNIVRVSIIGIITNLVLVAMKMTVGLISGSVAIVNDAINNLSDALSSLITIVGTKLAGRKPDKKHPYGYGKIEYIASVSIAVIILLAGFTGFTESLDKLLHPQQVNYSHCTLSIVTVGILVKFFLSRYVKAEGEKYSSESLIASGIDAGNDALISLSTLAVAAIYLLLNINLEGIAGTVISFFIIKSGIEILLESMSAIIGERIESETSQKIKERVCSLPQVKGAYDLTLHRYGPEKMIGSVHIEVDDEMTAREIHRLTREISTIAFSEFGIIMTVGIYASNDNGEVQKQMKQQTQQLVSDYPEVLELHGFYVNEETKNVTFDLVIDFKCDHKEKVKEEITGKLKAMYPDYTFFVVIDDDFSD